MSLLKKQLWISWIPPITSQFWIFNFCQPDWQNGDRAASEFLGWHIGLGFIPVWLLPQPWSGDCSCSKGALQTAGSRQVRAAVIVRPYTSVQNRQPWPFDPLPHQHQSLQWLTSFLQAWRQRVVLGERMLPRYPFVCRVPERTILFPMFLNIYMYPLARLVWRFGLGCQQYVDDIQLYLLMGGQLDTAPINLVKGLEAMVGWLKQSWLRLNPSTMDSVPSDIIGFYHF